MSTTATPSASLLSSFALNVIQLDRRRRADVARHRGGGLRRRFPSLHPVT
jgi:hypothetical protein